MVGVRGRFLGRLEEEGGAIIALVAFLMLGLLGFLALAVDLGHLVMVKNELQNAADAGALAGASVLYDDSSPQVNGDPAGVPYVNKVAYDTATSNRASIFPTGWSPVQVNWTYGTNEGDVQRGHYNYVTGVFTRNDALDPPVLAGGSEASLNADPNFINAVRVVTRTSTASLFAGILGITTSDLSAEAIAYIGFAKELNPRDVDQPIAICQDWLAGNACDNWPANDYRMVPDGAGQIARWMTLNQASNPQADISCGAVLTGNRDILPFDSAMGISTFASNLTVLDVFRDQNWGNSSRCAMNDSNNDGIRDAPIDSDADGVPDRPWVMTLPVIDCSTGNPMSTPPVGRVRVEVIWITPGSNVCADTPFKMTDGRPSGINWECNVLVDPLCGSDPVYRWQSFAQAFGFRDSSGPTLDCNATSLQNVMFIKPVCEDVGGTLQPVRPTTGNTGSHIYGQRGQLSKYPVLVK